MIDGRGRVKITDFGLASLERTIEDGEIRSGTPAYMAPEQLKGREVTVKSDIYALGLVLYELFTGKQAFDAATPTELARLHSDSAPSRPSSHVEGFDPAVERVILRCLEKEPSQRPASALAVSAGLPGGDPLAAALAAGETPSPEMVANAGEREGLRPWVALVCMSVTIGGLVAGAFFLGKTHLFAIVGMDKPPQVLAAEARSLLEELGHDEQLDHAYGFGRHGGYLAYVKREKTPEERWEDLSTVQPAPIYFWYRESPRYLVPVKQLGSVGYSDPPIQVSGMANVLLDARGRLMELTVIPPQVDEAEPPWPEPDWGPLLAAAGFSPETLTSVRPVWNALVDVDRRVAWEGTYPGQDAIPVRVEAAAYHGKPVFFRVVLPWTRPIRLVEKQSETGSTIATTIMVSLFGAVMIGGFVLAWRNLRLGRGDRQGTLRLSVFIFCTVFLFWVLGGWRAVPNLSQLGWFLRTVSNALLSSFVAGVLYLALEPYARRLWPELWISWARLLQGRFRDPRIGRDILFAGVAAVLGVSLQVFLERSFGPIGHPIEGANPNLLAGPRYVVWGLLMGMFGPISQSLFLLTVLVLFRILLRRQWIAVAIVFLVITAAQGAGTSATFGWVAGLSSAVVISALFLFVLVRFGLLAMVFFSGFGNALAAFPIVLGSSTWYSGYSLTYLLAWIALVVYGFYISLAGRRVFSDTLLEAEH
jgi:serine/threonine-protein kinase